MAVLDSCEQSNEVNEVKDSLMGEKSDYVKSEECRKSGEYFPRHKKWIARKWICILFVVVIVAIIIALCAIIGFIATSTRTDKECVKDIKVLNGKFANETGFLPGDEADIECNDGYQVNGSETISCQPSGHWNETPICLPIQCNKLRLPEHVKVDLRHLSHNHNKVSVVCDDGFNLEGRSTVFCQNDGSWSKIPTCKPVNCGFPSTVNKGVFLYLVGTMYENTFSVKCDEGYVLNGNSNIKCKSDGKWEDLPECNPVSCGTPIIPNHAHIYHIGGSTFNETVSFKCEDGFTLVGHNTSICKSSGQWSAFPECKRECLSSLNITNGRVTKKGNKNVYGIEAGKWLEGDIAYIECLNGYKVNGSDVSVCLSSGEWSESPVCVRKQCAAFKTPMNAKIISPKQMFYYVNDEVTISCLQGFRVSGSGTVKCLDNEKWTNMPICAPIMCDRSPVVSNSLITDISGVRYFVNDTTRITCRGGFNLKGNGIATCGLDGNWIGLPKCERVSCGQPTAQTSAYILKKDCMVFECIVELRCKPGYSLIGNGNSVCQANGQWTSRYECRQNKVVPDPPRTTRTPTISNNNNNYNNKNYNNNNNHHAKSGRQGIHGDVGIYTLLKLFVTAVFIRAISQFL